MEELPQEVEGCLVKLVCLLKRSLQIVEDAHLPYVLEGRCSAPSGGLQQHAEQSRVCQESTVNLQ